MEHDTMLDAENDGAGGRVVERAVGERNGAATGRAAGVGVPDPELVDRPVRRRFSAEYKRSPILYMPVVAIASAAARVV
jgi:hypothetical protein